MSDFEPIHRPVLGSATALLSRQIQLMPLVEGAVVQVFGKDAAVADFAKTRGLSLRANGPGQWYLVGDEPLPAGTLGGLAPSLFVVDQSHGRVRMAVDGPAARVVLAKGTGLDVSTLKVGDATTTLIGHIAAHITRTGPDRFELMPLRGFAESLWHDLETMAAEFAD